MSNSIRPKMSREDRAKQFMPFAALKGYEDALRAKEHIVVPKTELSEEKLSELNEAFQSIYAGCMLECVYYDTKAENYIKKTGILTKIDEDSRIIKIVNYSIKFDDICEIRLISSF